MLRAYSPRRMSDWLTRIRYVPLGSRSSLREASSRLIPPTNLHRPTHDCLLADNVPIQTFSQRSCTQLMHNRNRNIISNIKISYCILYLKISSITKITGITKLLLLLKTSNTIQRLTVKLICIILCSSVQTNLTTFSFSTLGDTAVTRST